LFPQAKAARQVFIADDADWRISEDVDGFADGGVG
jgi:hypothetical protein